MAHRSGTSLRRTAQTLDRYDCPRAGGISSSVERELPKLERRVRFPYPASGKGVQANGSRLAAVPILSQFRGSQRAWAGKALAHGRFARTLIVPPGWVQGLAGAVVGTFAPCERATLRRSVAVFILRRGAASDARDRALGSVVAGAAWALRARLVDVDRRWRRGCGRPSGPLVWCARRRNERIDRGRY